MTKEQSLQIKGIAILFMLWLHLFVYDSSPFFSKTCLACNPVVLFLLVSGYGYSYKYRKGTLNLKNTVIKSLKLYIIYWMTMVVFVALGSFINPKVYPGGLGDVLMNVTGVNCTYNIEMWFLFPYVLVTLLSVGLLPLAFSLKKPMHVVFAYAVYFAIFLVLRYMMNHIEGDPQWLFLIKLQVFYVYMFVFYFSMGVLFYALFKGKKFSTDKSLNFLILLVALFALKSMFKRTMADAVYAFFFVYLFLHVRVGQRFSKVLCILGKYSLGMWLTHTYFSKYLFPQYISWSEYHIVNFLTLVAVSFVTAFLFQKAWGLVVNKIS